MKSKKITINETDITVFEDGSIEKLVYGKPKRQLGYKHKGYRRINIGSKNVSVHRVVSEAFLSDYSKGLQVDHINGDGEDNRIENLRMVTHQENLRAFNRPTRGASSEFRGVRWNKQKKKWTAQIMINKKQKHLGHFTSEFEAALAFNDGAIKYGYAEEALNPI